MTPSPHLSSDQFAHVSETFSEVVTRGLRGEAARDHIDVRAGRDDAIRATLLRMLEAHESEARDEDDTGAFRRSALESVRAESAAAGEGMDRHVPDRIGPYRVTRFIASGGMGTVYEAEQDEPRRRVAIKVLRLGMLTRESIQRFESEGHLLARLRHPGIARVYAMGRMETPAGPVPYLVLEYIDGVPITQFVKANALDVPARLALLRRVADAVQFAHDNAVLHRDLKPGNVLVDSRGHPHVLDFGIGRTLDDESAHATLTASGLFLGTLAYMSPEQAVRTSAPLDVRVDVYGLGAVGYELLSEKPPKAVRDLPLHEAIQRVAQRESRSLDSVDPTISSDLGAIFSKALAVDRERRYRSVREFNDDIGRYLAHEPVAARPPSRLYLLRKLVRRNRMNFALLALLLLTLVAGLVVSLTQRSSALDAEAKAKRLASDAMQEHRAALLAGARTAVEGNRLTEVGEVLEELDPSHADPAVELRLLRASAYNATRILDIDRLPGGTLAVSPRGDLAASVDQDGVLWCVDLNTATLRRALATETRFTKGSVSWCHGEIPWLVVTTPERVTVIDCQSRRIVRTIDASSTRVPLPRGSSDYLLWRHKSGLDVVGLSAGALVEDPRVSEILARPHVQMLRGQLLTASSSKGGSVRFDLGTHESSFRKVRADFGQHGYSADGRFDLFGLHGPIIHDAAAGETWRLDKRGGVAMADFAFGRDTTLAAVLFVDGSLELWDLEQRVLVRRLRDTRLNRERFQSSGRFVRFLPDGTLRTLLGRTVVDWVPTMPPSALRHVGEHSPTPFIYSMDWHPDGRWLASAAWDGRVVVWDTWTGTRLGDLDVASAMTPEMTQVEKGYVVPELLAWSPDGRRLGVQLHRGATVVWDVWARTVVFRGIVARRVMAVRNDGFWIEHPETGGISRVGYTEAEAVRGGKRVLTRNGLLAWALDPRAEVLPGRWVMPVRRERHAAAPSGAQNSAEFVFTVWDVERMDDEPWRQSTTAQVLSTCLTRDGDRLFTGLRDGSIHLYDVARRQRLMILHAHQDYVSVLSVAPDQSMLASGSGDGWVKLWPLTPVAERVARVRLAEEQRLRLAPIIDRAWSAGTGAAARRDACLADPNLLERDRAAALALLFARGE